MTTPHYLHAELLHLVRTDPAIFRFLCEGSLDGVWYWDIGSEDGAEWMDEQFWRTLGYDPATKKNLASEWMGLIHPEDLKVASANLEKHFADPNYPYDQVVRYQRANGTYTTVRCRGIAIRDENGAPVRMLGAHNDVTELHRRQDALEEQAEALKQRNRDLGQFAYIASHDLQQPLRMITNFTEIFVETITERIELTKEEQKYVGFILSGTKNMQLLISGILEFSRAGMNLEMGRFPMQEAYNRAVQMLQDKMAAENATITVEGELPTILGDHASIMRLLMNLIGNALKFRHEDRDPVIKVSAKDCGDRFEVSIQDNGTGFDPQYAARIFEVCVRLGTKVHGTGLGLAISRRIVEKHGGLIWAEGVDGEGATIFFTLMKGGS